MSFLSVVVSKLFTDFFGIQTIPEKKNSSQCKDLETNDVDDIICLKLALRVYIIR